MQKEINSLKKKNHSLIILTKDGLNVKKSKNKKNVNNTVNSRTLLTLKGEDFTIKMNLINTSEINKEKILKTVISMKKHLVDSEGEEINPKNNKNDKKSLNSYFQNENILIESKDSERMSDFDLILKFNGKLNVNKNVSETMKKGSEHTIKQSCRAMICKTNSEIDKFTELDKKNINQIKDISKFGVKSKNECEIIKNNNISVYDNNNINNENNKIKDSSNIFNDSNHCRIISYSNKKNNILNSNIYSITNLENNKNNTNNINLGNDIKLKNNYISSQTSVNNIAKIKNNISQASLPLKNNIKNIYNENENITDNISENKQLISIKKLKKFNNPINVDQNKNIQPIQILNNKDKSSKRESKFSKNNSTNLFEDNNNRIIPAKIDDNRRLKCLICEKVFKENKIFAPRCEKHLMCRKCIKSYYEEIIENNSFILKCPFTKCNEEIDFEILKTIISPIHCEMIITQQKKSKNSSNNIYNLNNNSISNSVGKELILKDTKLIFNTKIKNDNLKFYSQNHVIDINSNEKLYMYNKNKDIFCQKCLNPTLFTKINGYFIKCLNCDYKLCKYCLREFSDYHMDIMSPNHCKVYYRRDDYYFDNPHIIIKYLLQLFFVFSMYYLTFAGIFYIVLGFSKKLIKISIHNKCLLLIFICFAYLFSFIVLLACSPFIIIIHPFFPSILSLVDY